ncbi:unnamed protein product [Closterium sp. NIES-53]
MDAKMALWKSIGTYVDEVPPPGANIVCGMWIFRVKRPPGSPPVFKLRYVARGFSQQQGVDFFQTFSPTPKMTTLRVLLHVAAQRDYELQSLDFSTAFLQGSLHEEIWLTTLPALGFAPSTADSGASRSFFCDSTTLTLLTRPVAVSLADPSGGLVLAHSSRVLPCPAAPSGLLSGLHLPSFSTNLVSGADLQDVWIDQFTPGGQRVTHCTCSRMGRHLATFTRRPGSSLYTLTTASPPVTTSGQVAASGQVSTAASRSSPASAPCSCRPLSHETLLSHHRLGHPSLPRLRGMATRTLVSGLLRSLPPLPPGPAPTCVPYVEGQKRAAPHSSEFPPTEAPLQTLHMDVWGPALVRGQGHERYFLLIVDDYSRHTTVFPLRCKGEVTEVLIDWIRGARRQLSESFSSNLPGIRQTFRLPASPQQNGIAERRSGMVMDVAHSSMIHAMRLCSVSRDLNLLFAILPQTSWSSRAVPYGFLGFPPDAPGWQFYHPTSRRVLSSQDVTFDESLSYYHLFPYRTALPPPPPATLPSTNPVEPVEVAVDSVAATGAEPAGAGPGGAEPGFAESEGAEPGGAEPERVESGGAEPGGAESGGAEPERVEPGGAESGGAEPGGAKSGGPPGVPSRRKPLSPQRLREWYARRCSHAAGATWPAAGGASEAGAAGGAAGARAAGAAGPRGAGAGGTVAVGGPAGVGAAGASGPGGAHTEGTGAAGAGGAAGVGAVGAGAVAPGGAAGAGAAGGTGAGGAAGVVAGDPGAEGTGAVSAVSGGAAWPRPYYIPLLQQALCLPPSPGPTPPLLSPQPVQSQSQLLPASPVLGPSPYSGPTRGLTERREPETRPASPESRPESPVCAVCAVCIGRRRVPLLSPPASSLPDGPDPESDSLRSASPTVTRFLSTVVTDTSSTASTLVAVAALVDFAAACRVDYATSLVVESDSASVCPPSVGCECALGTDVLEDRQEEFECLPLLYLISCPCCLPLMETRMHQTSRPRALTQRR